MSSAQARLLARQQELRRRLAAVRSDLERKREPLSSDFADQATQRQNDEVLEEIGRATETELQSVERALRRIDGGQYEVCSLCGGPIEPARLEAVPYTDRCSDCAG